MCPEFSPQLPFYVLVSWYFPQFKNLKEMGFGPKCSPTFSVYVSGVFGTAECNCLGIDSQCKLAESLQVLHSCANLHSREFDTISVKEA